MKKNTIVPIVAETLQGNTKSKVSACVRWCFTLHDPTEADFEFIKSMTCTDVPKFKYCIYALEHGESGHTIHLQGYLELWKRKRWNELGFRKETHFEVAKGNREQNVDYISKEGGKIWINGRAVRRAHVITELRPWQKDIVNIVNEEPDERTINWYWEEKGGMGKTALCKYLVKHFNALVVSGKNNDALFGVINFKNNTGHYPDIIIIDIPRCIDSEYINYLSLEKLKDGCFFCGKYEGTMVLMPTPHIIVFSNYEPDISKMSSDRWKITNL